MAQADNLELDSSLEGATDFDVAESSPAAAPAPAEEQGPRAAVAHPPAPAGGDDCEECEECIPGAPAWLATFGDLMSLLVCFFVLILSFSDINVPKHKQISGSLKEAFGIQRLVPVVEPPRAQSLIAKEYSPTVSPPTLVNTIRQDTTDDDKRQVEPREELKREDFPTPEDLAQLEQMLAQEIARGQVEVRLEDNQLVVEMTNVSSAGGRQAGERGAHAGGEVSQEALETFAKVAQAQQELQRELVVVSAELAQVGQMERMGLMGQADSDADGDQSRQRAGQRDDLFEQLRAALSQDISQGLAQVEKEGDQVIVRLADQGSFNSGRADLQPGFLPILRRAGEAVAQSAGKVSIHGHTDNVPVMFNDRFQSNWDLSAARAAAVADFFINQMQMQGQRISVSGFADTQPIASNATADGRAANRRIEIIVDPA